jgi:hypothetical protein
MSCTIYGGKTKNNVIIDSMVDNNRDYVFWKDDEKKDYFARLAGYRENEQDDISDGLPAIVLFSNENPFEPIYAQKLSNDWNKYLDSYDNFTEEFINLLPNFWESTKEYCI